MSEPDASQTTDTPSTKPTQTVLVVGEREPLRDALCEALRERYDIHVEAVPRFGALDVVLRLAPDAVLLVGDAAGPASKSLIKEISGTPVSSVVPVLILAESPPLDTRLEALRYGAIAFVARSASADDVAHRVADLVRGIPDRSGHIAGEVGQATLQELVSMLGRELRSGILSVRGAGDTSEQTIRFVLGDAHIVNAAIRDFVARVKSVVRDAEVLDYEFDERARGTLQLLGLEADFDTDAAEIDDLRVVVADDDGGRADLVAQELRARGATCAIVDLEGRRTKRLRGFDPSVLVMSERDIQGQGFALVRQMREDPRLRWAFLLLVKWDDIVSEGAPQPAMESLVRALSHLGRPERTLRKRALEVRAFDTRLEVIGPARLLRSIVPASEVVRVTVHNPRLVVTVDIAGSLIASATATAEEAGEHFEGPRALAALLRLASGRVSVEPTEQPAKANLMASVDVALSLADSESVAFTASGPRMRPYVGKDGVVVRHVGSARSDAFSPAPQDEPADRAVPVVAIAEADPAASRERDALDRDQSGVALATEPQSGGQSAPDSARDPAKSSRVRTPKPAMVLALDAARAEPETGSAKPAASRVDVGPEPASPKPVSQTPVPIASAAAPVAKRARSSVAIAGVAGAVLTVGLIALGIGTLLPSERGASQTAGSRRPAVPIGDTAPTPPGKRAPPIRPFTLPPESTDAVPPAPSARVERMDPAKRHRLATQIRSDARRRFRRGLFDASARLYPISLAYEPQSADSAHGYALTLFRLRQVEQATGWAQRAVRLEPDKPEHLILLGDLRGARRDVDGARSAWNQALALDPSNRIARSRLGRVDEYLVDHPE